MATIYFRGKKDAGIWWTKFYHPLTAQALRLSLGTADESEARLMQRRLEAELDLMRPEIAAVQLPERVRQSLGVVGTAPKMLGGPHPAAPSSPPLLAPQTVKAALRAYHQFIAAGNDDHHVDGKLSILRALFGSACVEEATGAACRNFSKAYYLDDTFDSFTPVMLQEFVASRPVSDTTRKHYRQVLHHFFEKLIDFELFRPSNPLRPNPAASLPHYGDKNAVISFLTEQDVLVQRQALAGNKVIQLAVDIMIEAGLRREEVLGLRTEDISPDRRFLKIARYIDPRTTKPRKLKTGWRDVPVAETLQARLLTHLADHENFWLLPGWNNERWSADHFSKTLAELNTSAHIHWTCNEFRHTYATKLAKGGASLFKIAKLMGNSHQIVEKHYAQFVLDCDD